MHVYNANRNLSQPYLTCDINNCLRMRQDLTTLFNTGAFVLTPKRGASHVHFLTVGPNYTKTYHNCMTEDLDLAAEFVYARFAWAVFQMLRNFTDRGNIRVTIFNNKTLNWETLTVAELALRDDEARTPPTNKRQHDSQPEHSGGATQSRGLTVYHRDAPADNTLSVGNQFKRVKSAATSRTNLSSDISAYSPPPATAGISPVLNHRRQKTQTGRAHDSQSNAQSQHGSLHRRQKTPGGQGQDSQSDTQPQYGLHLLPPPFIIFSDACS